ncbi:hypothetical protein [Streptomyces sp. A1136]|uniref:hypothetical protein n=1 Tax=Streptomyces sp. A1136 TaxID=2563102 RepID=UPI00109E624F|nr:hypothetical protein [Streptomyces sp. A1136]THA53264.1 hypothetical protein E6R62_19435 [Streptomyces sp. A1136]
MKYTYTIIGDWYEVWDLADSFAVVAEGADFEEAKTNAAAAVLETFPWRAEEDGETPETLWGGDNGAYVVAAFLGDLGAQAVDAANFRLIA